ncbi:hypothetical protein Pmar_PMAR022045, partial [Perkinsus marinus ATCC 50983]
VPTFLAELSIILRAALSLGVFPKCWKSGLLVAIPKAGRQFPDGDNRLKRVRPITLLRTGGKILEKPIVA